MNKFSKISFEQYELDANHTNPPYYSLINIHKEYDDIKIPKRATTGSAGYDFFAPFAFSLYPGESIKIPTGIKVVLDDDKFLAVYPRSGLGCKFRIQLDNTVGIIDSDYSSSDNEGHIFAKLTNDNKEGKVLSVNKGEAFMQGIITQFFKTIDDEADGTRNGGFGSTSANTYL